VREEGLLGRKVRHSKQKRTEDSSLSVHLAGASKMASERRLSGDSAGRSVEGGTASERD
jgi:hypothetical protein